MHEIYCSPYTGTTYTVSSDNCPKFLMRYQQVAPHAYCGASVQDGVAAGKGLPSPLATPFARSNAMRFLSLGVR